MRMGPGRSWRRSSGGVDRWLSAPAGARSRVRSEPLMATIGGCSSVAGQLLASGWYRPRTVSGLVPPSPMARIVRWAARGWSFPSWAPAAPGPAAMASQRQGRRAVVTGGIRTREPLTSACAAAGQRPGPLDPPWEGRPGGTAVARRVATGAGDIRHGITVRSAPRSPDDFRVEGKMPRTENYCRGSVRRQHAWWALG